MSTCCSTQNVTMISASPVSRTNYPHKRASGRGFFHVLWQRFLLRRQQKIDRDAFMTMLSLDDGLLNDIGVTRGDVMWAANLPLSTDAATALRESTRGLR